MSTNIYHKSQNLDMESVYQELKTQILQKTSFMKKNNQNRKDIFMDSSDNFYQKFQSNEMFQVSQMKCFQYHFKQHDQVTLFFNQYQKQLEIKMHDIEKLESKGSLILIVIPYNEQMSLIMDPKKLIFQIKTFHLKVYKNNQNKKGNNWEKINVLNYKLFDQLDKKLNNFKFDILLMEGEYQKFQSIRQQVVQDMQRHKVQIRTHQDDNKGLCIKQIPLEKFGYFMNSEKELESIDKEKKIQQLKSITGDVMKQLAQTKKLICPLYTCFKEFKVLEQLKNHLEQQHPELASNGLELDSSGNLSIKEKQINQLIMICKMLPDFMKKEVFTQRSY